ncbi:MAG: FAD-dependent oxidoreductase [Candidatus Eremiobacteraeota bacterium]|nr:FAD-dependent oxidoreductase [Candidatus Eremiobacteraeota bacterium]
MDGSARPPRIVILGGGFGGITVARRLEARLQPHEAEIVLVSRENFSLFTPMLPEVSSGELEVRDVVTPIRSQLRRTRFILADVTAVDVEESFVDVAHTLTGTQERITYDRGRRRRVHRCRGDGRTRRTLSKRHPFLSARFARGRARCTRRGWSESAS